MTRPSMSHVIRLVLLLAMCSSARAVAQQIHLIDGRTMDQPIIAIEDGQVHLEGADQPLDLMAFEQYTSAALAAQQSLPVHASGLMIHLPADGRIHAVTVRIADERVNATTAAFGTWQVSLTNIRGIRWLRDTDDESQAVPPAEQARAFLQMLRQPDRQQDRVLLIRDDQMAELPVIIEACDDERLTILWRDQQRSIALDRVVGFVTAQLSRAQSLRGAVRIVLSDGSYFWARELHMSAEVPPRRLRCQPIGLSEPVTVSWSDVLGLEVRSTRVAYLSAITPDRVQQQTLFGLPLNWQRDRNVMGEPLTLDGKTYRRGIGVIADCALTWQLEASYDRLKATIGLDDGASPQGSVTFRVIGDGKTLYEQAIHHGEAAQAINVPIAGVRELTLEVDGGSDELADHANWAEVRLLRDPE